MAIDDPYLDVNAFKTRTVMSPEDVELLEEKAPGFLLSRLKIGTSRITAKLRKRYDAPFASPVPEVVLGWLTAMVTPDGYRKRGWNPSDEQAAQVEQDRKDALAEIDQAADSVEGLYDLPLRADTTATGITRGGPLVYSEPSPYDWTDRQREAIRGR